MATYSLNPSSLDSGISELGGVTNALAAALDGAYADSRPTDVATPGAEPSSGDAGAKPS